MANVQSFERAEYQQVKADLHRKILDRLDLEKLGRSQGDSAREEVLAVIRNAVNAEVVPLSFAERERLSREILDEIFGLGPLEPLLKDQTITDILINTYAMESCELRARKIAAHSPGKGANAADMCAVFAREAMDFIESTARTVLAACVEGDTLRTNLAVLRRFTKFEPVNVIGLRQRIAKRLLDADRYVV